MGVLLLISSLLSAQSRDLKVMTYNILTGFDWGKDTTRQTKMVEWLNEQAPDVLALQELCDFTQQKLEMLALGWGHEYAVILKEDGYPVGLTSSRPIVVKEKVRKDLWHGMLHCTTWDIDFYVVHLSPSDWQFRRKEAEVIGEKVRAGREINDKYVVLGDFNAHSPFDGEFDLKYPYQLERSRKSDEKNQKYQNLNNGHFDYSVMSSFLALPLLDVCQRFVLLDNRTTCPAPINVPKWLTQEEMEVTRSRIDYILVSQSFKSKVFRGRDSQWSCHTLSFRPLSCICHLCFELEDNSDLSVGCLARQMMFV